MKPKYIDHLSKEKKEKLDILYVKTIIVLSILLILAPIFTNSKIIIVSFATIWFLVNYLKIDGLYYKFMSYFFNSKY